MYLTQGLHRSVRATPDLAATIFGNRTRSWAELGDRVARLAGGLIDLGVRSGDRIAILSPNSDAYHEGLFGSCWADAVFVPLNTRWSANEVAFALRDCAATALILGDPQLPVVGQLQAEAPELCTVIHAGDGETPAGLVSFDELTEATRAVPDARRGGADVAGIFYTGGTTGRSKGVMLSHRNLLSCAAGCASTGHFVAAGDRSLSVAPLFHVAGFIQWVTRVALSGTFIILPEFDPVEVAAAIEKHRPGDLVLVPTMIQMLVDSPATAEHDLSSLRHLIYGGSPITEAVLERARKRLPSTGFTQSYGMTELSPCTTLLTPADHDDPALLSSGGRAAPHSEIRVLDPLGNEVPRGTVGEICSRGDHVMLGYWNRPQETAEALRDGWMHSGDGGYMDEQGYVFVADRFKDMIVSGGENVYSVEVENALSRHPAVVTCAVIGVPDDNWGERVHALVVLAPGNPPTLDQLRAHVKRHIAGYKAPRSVDYVDSLPMSGPGKVLKRELRARYWGGQDRAVS